MLGSTCPYPKGLRLPFLESDTGATFGFQSLCHSGQNAGTVAYRMRTLGKHPASLQVALTLAPVSSPSCTSRKMNPKSHRKNHIAIDTLQSIKSQSPKCFPQEARAEVQCLLTITDNMMLLRQPASRLPLARANCTMSWLRCFRVHPLSCIVSCDVMRGGLHQVLRQLVESL